MADDLGRNIDRLPYLAQELVKLAKDLQENFVPSDYPLDSLLMAAEVLAEIHRFIDTVPEVVRRAKLASFLEGYRSAANLVRGMAAEIEASKIELIRPQTALLRAAAVLEEAGQDGSERPKPKLVVN
jgi:hypothetical protein